jgi:hypothetical protein
MTSVLLPAGSSTSADLWLFDAVLNEYVESGQRLFAGQWFEFSVPLDRFLLKGLAESAANSSALTLGFIFETFGKVDLVWRVSATSGADVLVPNVVGQSQASAEAAITAAGLAVGTVGTAASSTVPSGVVLSQSPAGGASATPGSAVNLVVSSGPAAAVRGDLDGDGDVDANDLQAFRAVLGKSQGDPGFNPAADFDGDGRITINDLRIMRSLLP